MPPCAGGGRLFPDHPRVVRRSLPTECTAMVRRNGLDCPCGRAGASQSRSDSGRPVAADPAGDRSQQEWVKGFSRWDTAIPRGTEPAYDFRGGLADSRPLVGPAGPRDTRRLIQDFGPGTSPAWFPRRCCSLPGSIRPNARISKSAPWSLRACVCSLAWLRSRSTDIGTRWAARVLMTPRGQPAIRRQPPWLWIFLIAGGLTMLVISLFLPVLPVSPPGPRPDAVPASRHDLGHDHKGDPRLLRQPRPALERARRGIERIERRRGGHGLRG